MNDNEHIVDRIALKFVNGEEITDTELSKLIIWADKARKAMQNFAKTI